MWSFKSYTDAKFEPSYVTFLRLMPRLPPVSRKWSHMKTKFTSNEFLAWISDEFLAWISLLLMRAGLPISRSGLIFCKIAIPWTGSKDTIRLLQGLWGRASVLMFQPVSQWFNDLSLWPCWVLAPAHQQEGAPTPDAVCAVVLWQRSVGQPATTHSARIGQQLIVLSGKCAN